MPFIRSISGIRATLGDGLNPSVLSKYISAFVKLQGKGKFIVGRDGRPSGTWIENLVTASILSSGGQVELLGVVPTPTVQLLTEHSDAVGGISITASHNPGEWNGLKFLGNNGVFLDADQNAKLFSFVDSNDLFFTSSQEFPEYGLNIKATSTHIDSILNLEIFEAKDVVQKIKERNLKVVVDAVNASGSKIVPTLLKILGFEVIELYCNSSGIFPHTPEPIPANLTELQSAVLKHNADLGIAVDPDADRLVLIDENGEPIGEEKTIVLSAETVFKNYEYFKGEKNVVVNLSTSRMINDLAHEHSFDVFRSPVGEIYVVKKMKEFNSVFGGEGSGGVILPSSHFGRDSLVGIGLISSLLAIEGKSLSELAGRIPKYEIVKSKREFSGEIHDIIEKVKEIFPEADVNMEDGLRLDFEKSWVQVRKSNTEPIIRVISEARSLEESKRLNDQIISMI